MHAGAGAGAAGAFVASKRMPLSYFSDRPRVTWYVGPPNEQNPSLSFHFLFPFDSLDSRKRPWKYAPSSPPTHAHEGRNERSRKGGKRWDMWPSRPSIGKRWRHAEAFLKRNCSFSPRPSGHDMCNVSGRYSSVGRVVRAVFLAADTLAVRTRPLALDESSEHARTRT